MKNITVSLADDDYRQARIAAAELDTSVSALVKQFLAEVAEERRATSLQRREKALRESIAGFRGGDRLSREQAHDRVSLRTQEPK